MPSQTQGETRSRSLELVTGIAYVSSWGFKCDTWPTGCINVSFDPKEQLIATASIVLPPELITSTQRYALGIGPEGPTD